MDPEHESGDAKRAAMAGAKPHGHKPAWANGLQELYKSVIDEPLPDSFRDLLAKLDDQG